MCEHCHNSGELSIPDPETGEELDVIACPYCEWGAMAEATGRAH